ncbi:exonuclease SbcCD subunit D [Kurthia sibirica]|uniref:Nuclease SbcCD subunit D n=1 Tax=Kurthia sibirica TaxID=202750 RepID=A0A2U3ANB5_9BACL|nr:exonuclease SbcCD subunit D [Kurthia sibirica]PWI26011.1 exonuclease sbcCD subunit D [Kurthia sibirica]GEK35270.1 nuclease SbcCD subunit D [Kurthia sibirica]
MRILHTADWHLGKVVQGVSMLEEQRYIMQQLLAAIDDLKPDVVIVAGDIYDRSIPPVEAVKLLDETFKAIVKERHIPLLAIAGNHDSTSRIDFGSELFKTSGLYMRGKLDAQMPPIILQDEFGEVAFYLIPFADPQEVRYVFNDDAIRSNEQAMAKIMSAIDHKYARSVCIGHAFVTKNGVEEENPDDGERPLSIGGSECVDSNLFMPFSYTALGHLHQAHFVQDEKIRYSGSPLKYSISEENHKKGFLLIDLAADGKVTIDKQFVKPLRDMRRIEGKMDELLAMTPSDDYVYVTLLDDTVIITPMEKIRTVFPNAMHIERKILRGELEVVHLGESRQAMDSQTLFTAFYAEILGEQPDDAMQTLFNELLQDELDEEREQGGQRR